jgi:CheY-like chemotaxis protein
MQEGEPVSILCVDDEPLFLDAFAQTLAKQPGFEITVASSAAIALEVTSSRYFDVIVADYAMPEMDGIALLKELRARGCQSLFVMITAKRLAHIAIDALNAGADYYLQKGADAGPEYTKLVGFIRQRVPERRSTSQMAEWGRFYQSVIDNQADLVFRTGPDGAFRYANEPTYAFFGRLHGDLMGANFFSLLPGDEREAVLARLGSLTPAAPVILMEHRVNGGDQKPALLQWSYRAIFTDAGAVAEYQVAGRMTAGLVRLGVSEPAAAVPPATGASPVPPPLSTPSPAPGPAPVPAADEEPPDWQGLVETIESLTNPVFAVDRNGVIIAWNPAIAELTGVPATAMIGKGGSAYAIPFYGKPVPMLIDRIIRPDSHPGTGITKIGDTFIGDVEHIAIRGKPMLLWGKGSPVHGQNGTLIAAIEAITVGEPQKPAVGSEVYFGGISSITLKVSGEGLGGAIAGAIGSASGGYGIYATDHRIFVIRNPELSGENPQGVQFGTFMMDELFGTAVDTRERAVDELEKLAIWSAGKEEIAAIDLKKPVLLSGFVNMTTKNGGSFRVYVDHKKAYSHIEQLMKAFAPEVLKIE